MKQRLSTTIKKQNVLQQYISTGGNAQLSCKNAKISRSQFYKWIEVDKIFKFQIESILKGVVKCSEDKILAKAMAGDIDAWNKKLKSSKAKLQKLV